MEPERKLKVRQRSKLCMSRLFLPFSVQEERHVNEKEWITQRRYSPSLAAQFSDFEFFPLSPASSKHQSLWWEEIIRERKKFGTDRKTANDVPNAIDRRYVFATFQYQSWFLVHVARPVWCLPSLEKRAAQTEMSTVSIKEIDQKKGIEQSIKCSTCRCSVKWVRCCPPNLTFAHGIL